jgi:hypothetical protein
MRNAARSLASPGTTCAGTRAIFVGRPDVTRQLLINHGQYACRIAHEWLGIPGARIIRMRSDALSCPDVLFSMAGLPALQRSETGQVRKQAATAIYCKCRGLGSPPPLYRTQSVTIWPRPSVRSASKFVAQPVVREWRKSLSHECVLGLRRCRCPIA